MALAIRKVSNSIQAKAKSEAQLGDSETESKEPRRVGCGKPLTDGHLCGIERTNSRHGGEVRAGALSCA